MFSDEKAKKLKKENDKLRKRITSLQRENAKQSGVSSRTMQSHCVECHGMHPFLPGPTEELEAVRREVDYLSLLVSSVIIEL